MTTQPPPQMPQRPRPESSRFGRFWLWNGTPFDPLAMLLDREPVRMRDDAQVLDLGHLPFAGRVRADDAAARLRVIFPARLVVDEAAVIELVLEHAVLADPVAVDRADPPQAAGGAGHLLAVELPADHHRRLAGEEFAIDAADDLGLGLVDRGQSLLDRDAVLEDAVGDPVAIGAAAGDPALGAMPRWPRRTLAASSFSWSASIAPWKAV
jgi:hypothetical protein